MISRWLAFLRRLEMEHDAARRSMVLGSMALGSMVFGGAAAGVASGAEYEVAGGDSAKDV